MRVTGLLLIAGLAGGHGLFAQTLKLAKPVISQFEDGPAAAPSQKSIPGETIFFSVAAEGYKIVDGKVRMAGHAQLFDSNGVAATPREEIIIGTSLNEEDKEWKPKIRAQFFLPPIAPGGAWHVRYDAEDLQSGQKQAGEITFTVEGHAAQKVSGLVIRDFGSSLTPKYFRESSSTAGSSSTEVTRTSGRKRCRYQAMRPPPDPISRIECTFLAYISAAVMYLV